MAPERSVDNKNGFLQCFFVGGFFFGWGRRGEPSLFLVKSGMSRVFGKRKRLFFAVFFFFFFLWEVERPSWFFLEVDTVQGRFGRSKCLLRR